MFVSARSVSFAKSSFSKYINQKYFVRRISTQTYFEHRNELGTLAPHAVPQGPVDCDFASDAFLLADKPSLQAEPWWKRILSGDNGSSHLSTLVDRRPTVDRIVSLMAEEGQVKLHAKRITIKADASQDGLGTRFAPDSFHCINIVKLFNINDTLVALSYDPEANCGVSDVERIGALQPFCDEIPELGPGALAEIQAQCAMFRVDDLKLLLGTADFSHVNSGAYIAKSKRS